MLEHCQYDTVTLQVFLSRNHVAKATRHDCNDKIFDDARICYLYFSIILCYTMISDSFFLQFLVYNFLQCTFLIWSIFTEIDKLLKKYDTVFWNFSPKTYVRKQIPKIVTMQQYIHECKTKISIKLTSVLHFYTCNSIFQSSCLYPSANVNFKINIFASDGVILSFVIKYGE